jgi:hypothetical protein
MTNDKIQMTKEIQSTNSPQKIAKDAKVVRSYVLVIADALRAKARTTNL